MCVCVLRFLNCVLLYAVCNESPDLCGGKALKNKRHRNQLSSQCLHSIRIQYCEHLCYLTHKCMGCCSQLFVCKSHFGCSYFHSLSGSHNFELTMHQTVLCAVC